MRMSPGQTSVQHFVILNTPMPTASSPRKTFIVTSGTDLRLLPGLPRARDEPGPSGVVNLNVLQARCVKARLQVTSRECVETGQPAASGGADSGGSSFSATKCGNRKATRWLEDAADLAQGTSHVREQVQ